MVLKEIIMLKKQRYGSKNSIPYILDQKKACNIDEPKDLIIAEYF